MYNTNIVRWRILRRGANWKHRPQDKITGQLNRSRQFQLHADRKISAVNMDRIDRHLPLLA
jgi:hypothetical protein